MSNSENTDPGRIRTSTKGLFGIRMTLPEHDTFRLVLGDDAQMYRWYASPTDRDAALAEMQREHLFSRAGDRPTLLCEKIERERPDSYTRGPQASPD